MNEAQPMNHRRFLWGILLVCASSIPVGIGFFDSFRGLSGSKATGIGAVAGGIAESFVPFGLACALVFSAVGIVFLVRTFSREHWWRSLFAAAAICLSTMTIILVVVFGWYLHWLATRR